MHLCFFHIQMRQMRSHKCLLVEAKDSPHDKSMLLTIITKWAAPTLSDTNLQGVISQDHNTVGNILVMLDV